MIYNDMPVIIPLLATGYLLTVYLLLMLAQRTTKSSRYVANSFTDAYAPYVQTEHAPQTDEIDRWSLRPLRSGSLAYSTSGMKTAKRAVVQRDTVESKELPPAASQPQQVPEASSVR